jgi:hypothetical protein
MAMGKEKSEKQPPNRFAVGTHGGCEARLFEFREQHLSEPRTVRIAALGLDEALAGLRWHEPEFEIESVQNLGIILMVSGSPAE